MTDTSTFDPDTFMNTEVEGEMETRYTPVPPTEGSYYTASIDDVAVRKIPDSVLLDVTWLLHEPDLAENMGMDRLTVRQSIFLDFELDGRLAFGLNKNVRLGKLRAAVHQNTAKAWSFAMLRGAGPCQIEVTIEPDKNDPEIKYNRVTKVFPA